MADPGPFVADLRAESDDLDALVAHLPADRWADPTPAPGWTIAHQIGHLLWTDRVALTAVTDEAGFAELMTAAAANPAGFVDDAATELAAVSPAELLTDWRVTGAAARGTAGGSRWPQIGLVRATDERGVDGNSAVDGDLGTWTGRRRRPGRHPARHPATAVYCASRCPHPRLRVHRQQPNPSGRAVPGRAAGTERRHLVLGPSDAAQRVTGSAEDFCFLVTQRRALSTLDVNAVGRTHNAG